MKKNKHVLPEDVLKFFAESDHLLVNKLSDGNGTYCQFDLLKDSKGVRFLSDQFKRDIKPHLPWKKISAVLKDLPQKMKIENIEWVVFILIPFPIEHMIFEEGERTIIRVDETELDRTFEKMYGQRLTKMAGQIIKLRAGLKGQLEKLQAEIYDYDGYTPIYWKEYNPLALVISELDRQIREQTALKVSLQKRVEIRKQLYSFDKNISKLPKKHSFWNELIPPALTVLNRFCHTDNCRPLCRKTHKTAYEKTAKILNILYPSIWPEDTKTVASQIKSMEQRIK